MELRFDFLLCYKCVLSNEYSRINFEDTVLGAKYLKLFYFSQPFKSSIKTLMPIIIILWHINPLLRSDSVNTSHCYEATTAYACAVTSTTEEVMQAVFL
jgi:hypothetical protein